MTFEIGQKVEMSPLGRARIEHREVSKLRRNGEIVSVSKAYPGSYKIKWATRKSFDQLHGDFIMDAAEYVEPAAQPQFGAWQPIDSAPMDGSCVLVSKINGRVGEAWYSEDDKNWWWAQTGPGYATGSAIYPEFWMPLPFPPIQSSR